jgi:hypothetical protein
MVNSFLALVHDNLEHYIARPLKIAILNEEDEHSMAFNRFILINVFKGLIIGSMKPIINIICKFIMFKKRTVPPRFSWYTFDILESEYPKEINESDYSYMYRCALHYSNYLTPDMFSSWNYKKDNIDELKLDMIKYLSSDLKTKRKILPDLIEKYRG